VTSAHGRCGHPSERPRGKIHVVDPTIPVALRTLFWDVDPVDIRLLEHADYVIERVMTRGTWEAMRWLRTAFSDEQLRGFLAKRGQILPPRERAYWHLVLDVPLLQVQGGGRPAWAGP
jgi:hypothetical protein